VTTEHPVEIVVWTNEEGSRFSPFTLGSMVFAGQVTLDFAYGRGEVTDPMSRRTVRDELARIGYLGSAPCTLRPVAGYFELHNEQGPELADGGHEVGIVSGSFSARYFVATIRGDAGHVGGTPMDLRKDALVGAARLVLELDRIGRAQGRSGRANAPHHELVPNVRGVIPTEVRLSCDVRHAEPATMRQMEAELRDCAARIAGELGMAIDVEQYYEFGPVRFDAGLQALLRETATRLGYRARDILTIAGHDAVSMNAVCPSAMLFVPSRAGGISHNEREYSTPEDLAAGTNVLLHAVLARAGARV
jgi:N-carbamoyl-L-amino-acid hydrolase